MNNNKNKNISNSYKDYKYVYTGFDDFMKSHHLDKKEIKEEKEKIVHDHRNVFDFNNPNQHTHDYSFDFNQNPEPPKQTTTTVYKDKYGNTYNKKTTTTTTNYNQPKYNYNQPRYNYNQTTQTTTTTYSKASLDKAAKKVKNIILIIFLSPIIISLITGIISFISFFNDDTNYETSIQEEVIYDNYLDPINALCDGIENNNYGYVWSYILTEEININNGAPWRALVYNYDEYGYPTYSEDRLCSTQSTIHPTSSQLISIEKEYQNKYVTSNLIEDAYQFEITVMDDYYRTYSITTIKIDGEWYLFKVE